MRLSALVLLLCGITVAYRRVTAFNGCELVGHDAAWTTPTLRVCRRRGCTATWRRDTGDIAATTTNQTGGW